jgi:hypothetical protein
MKYITTQSHTEKTVTNTIEVGEVKWTATLSCNRASRAYVLKMTYNFNHAEKSGEAMGFAIQRRGEDGEYSCEAVGEFMSETLFPLIAADFPDASKNQRDDIIGEIIESAETEASNLGVELFNSDYDRQQAYENA